MSDMLKRLRDANGFLPDESMMEFAEIVVKECILTIQLKIVRNGNTPENLRSYQHIEDIAKKFGIKLPMNYFGIE